MTRILDAYAIFEGEEPIFSTELTKIDMVKTLNWYCQNKVSKDAEKYILTYFKKNHKLNLEAEELKSCSTTFGYICRIITNGGILNSTNQMWFDEKVQEIKKSISTKKVAPVNVVAVKSNVISIQDRMAEKISIVAGELEGSVDDYVLNDFNKTPSPYSIMSDTIKAMHSPKIVTIFKKHRDEIELAIASDDEQLKEGYSHRSKSQLKKLAAYYNLIISDAIKLSEESKQGRKPRKTKAKTPAKLVAKLNYMDKFIELDLTSVSPQNIIGASLSASISQLSTSDVRNVICTSLYFCVLLHHFQYSQISEQLQGLHAARILYAVFLLYPAKNASLKLTHLLL